MPVVYHCVLCTEYPDNRYATVGLLVEHIHVHHGKPFAEIDIMNLTMRRKKKKS